MTSTFYEYHKIPALYERSNDGNKLLDETKFSRPIFEYLQFSKLIGTEKLDGTNIGIVWDGNRVHIQGRTPDAAFSAVQFECLLEKFGGPLNEELFEQHFGAKPVVLYGELIGAGIQPCGGCYCRDGYRFVLFDIYFPDNGLWANSEACKSFATVFNAEYALPVVEGDLHQCVKYVKEMPISQYGHLLAEGVVVRPTVEMFDNQGRRVIAKIKVRDFVDAQAMKTKDMEYRKNG